MRLTTCLPPAKRNETRWLGVIKVLSRYERLEPNIDDTNPELAELLPTAAQRNVIRRHSSALTDFKSVTESLQRENVTVGESQILFASLIDTYAHFNFNSYISTEASIVQSRAFEDALVRIQSGSEHEMLPSEEVAVQCLKTPITNSRDEEDDSDLSLQNAHSRGSEYSNPTLPHILIPDFCFPDQTTWNGSSLWANESFPTNTGACCLVL